MENKIDKESIRVKLQKFGFDDEEARKIAYLPEKYLAWEEFQVVINSKKRKICRPVSPVLIRIHEMFHERIFGQAPVSDYVAAFVVGRGVRYLLHKVAKDNPNFLWRIDLKNFFDTVTSDHLIKYLLSCEWDEDVAKYITHLVTYQGKIPVGGTCSGEITNLVLADMHNEIGKLAKDHCINYAAYADDMFFWGNGTKENDDIVWDAMKSEIKEIIKKHGLMLNYKKIVRTHGGALGILGAEIQNGVPYPTRESQIKLANMLSDKMKGKSISNRRIAGMASWLWSINNEHFIKVWKSSIKIIMKENPKSKLVTLFPREFRKHLTK